MALTKVSTHVIADDLALPGNPTTTTQSAGNNTTRLATTAFVTGAVSDLVDGAPSTLNTLNEIAAALNDDAALNTTLTNSIATKLPLAGGTLTGDLTISEATPTLKFTDTDNNYDATIAGLSGSLVLTADSGAEFGTETIQFHTGGSQKVTIDASGNVGIGTNDPANPISISAQMHGLYSQHRPSSGVGVGQGMYYKFNTANATPEIYSSIYTEIEDNTDGAESGKIALRAAKAGTLTTGLMVIGSTGNVGVGTSSPTARLSVVSENADFSAQFSRYSADDGLFLHSAAQSSHYNWMIATQENVHKGFEIIPSASVGARDFNTPALVILADSGNVGIGTNNPLNNLHIGIEGGGEGVLVKSTGDHSGMLQFNVNRSSGNRAIGQLNGLWNGTSVADIQLKTGSDTTNKDDGEITFHTSSANNIDERMRIDSSGNVGIGTTDPNQWASYTDSGATVLQVQDTSQRARMVINGGNGAHLDMVDYAGGSNDKHMNYSVDGGIAKFGSLNDAGNAWVQQNILIMDLGTGNVGIAQTSQYSKLSVTGAVTVTNPNNDLGGHTYSSYASLVNHGYLTAQAGYSGTIASGRKFVFKYNATSWKAFSGTLVVAATGGHSRISFGGYWNNSGSCSFENVHNNLNLTPTFTTSGQAVLFNLTLGQGMTHPHFWIEYHQSGGDGAPRMDRAEMFIL